MTMKRRPKNLIAFALAAFFAFGILCATFTAPVQALASVTDCSQTPVPMAMVGCERPSYLCGFNTGSNLLAAGAISSPRSNDSVKNALALALGVPSIDVSIEFAPPGGRERENVSLAEPGKVSTRLFNSILNL